MGVPVKTNFDGNGNGVTANFVPERDRAARFADGNESVRVVHGETRDLCRMPIVEYVAAVDDDDLEMIATGGGNVVRVSAKEARNRTKFGDESTRSYGVD